MNEMNEILILNILELHCLSVPFIFFFEQCIYIYFVDFFRIIFMKLFHLESPIVGYIEMHSG